MPRSSASERARIEAFQRLVARITKQLDPQLPSIMHRPPERMIDDGGGYGDPFEDRRPDIVKEDDAAIRRREV